MKKIKEFRIDSEIEPFNSEHLIIRSTGDVETIKNTKVINTRISKKVKFFKELDGALTLDFKMMNHYVRTPNYYHMSVIFDDDTEESHFYIDSLISNNQVNLKSVLSTYIEEDFLITVVKK